MAILSSLGSLEGPHFQVNRTEALTNIEGIIAKSQVWRAGLDIFGPKSWIMERNISEVASYH